MNEQTRQIIAKTQPSDYDGHTEFARMTPDQRLSWLDEANAAYLELHGQAKVAEDQAACINRK